MLDDDIDVMEARYCAEYWRRRAAAALEMLEPSNGALAVRVIDNNRFPWEEPSSGGRSVSC